MKHNWWITTVLIGLISINTTYAFIAEIDSTRRVIKKTTDFQVNGTGDQVEWTKADWLPITVQESAGRPLATQTKMLYSDKGIYFLFRSDDQKLTASIQEDYGTLFKEDVVEVFIWPDPSIPVYYEYELSPLNYELIILVPNINGQSKGWKPWTYRGDSRVQHATSVQGGDKKSNAAISGWTAEFFIPYRLLSPLVPGPPRSGTQWRGNLYRIDYDQGYQTWSWQKTSGSFHEFKKYGTWIFE